MIHSPPLILLPGMMADHRLLAAQQAAFPQLRIPCWPRFEPADSLATFAERIAQEIGPIGPCFVGGVSFGGAVAIELTRHLDALGCILISSVRSFSELPLRYRICRPAGFLNQSVFDAALRIGGRLVRPSIPRAAVRRMERMESSPFFRWATRAVLQWNPSLCNVPIAQIHGSRDRTFPVDKTQPNQIVENAGHMLVMTHPQIVNEFIAGFVAQSGA